MQRGYYALPLRRGGLGRALALSARWVNLSGFQPPLFTPHFVPYFPLWMPLAYPPRTCSVPTPHMVALGAELVRS